MLLSDRPRRAHRVPRRFGHSSKSIGVSSTLYCSSQPSSLLDRNTPISSLPISPVPSPSQPENVSSSRSLSHKLLFSFTCCSCKLHKRLAAVKCGNCSLFFHLGASNCLVFRRSSSEAIGAVTNVQMSIILRSLSKLIPISPKRHLLNICKTWN